MNCRHQMTTARAEFLRPQWLVAMETYFSTAAGWLRKWIGWHPLFAAALVAVACVVAADVTPAWGLVLAVAFAVVATACGAWLHGLAWGVCGVIAVSVFSWRQDAQSLAEAELANASATRLEARLLQDGRGRGRNWAAPARMRNGPQPGAIVWWTASGAAPVAGSVVRADGHFRSLEPPRNPGEFDRAGWLRREGVVAGFHATRHGSVVETSGTAALGASLRHGFRERVTAGLAEDSQAAQVIRAVVIGEKPADADALVAAFRHSGTLHAFTVSGLHVGMVGSIGWLLLAWAGVPRRAAVLILIPLVFGYAWITGLSAPAVRSACMAAVFLGAFVFRRRPDLLNALGAVLLLAMLWDGRLLFQPGVQLSYGVVAAIAVGTAWAARCFSWISQPDLYVPLQLMGRRKKFLLGLRQKLADSFAVSLAAGVGSTPLTAIHFGLVTPISIIANVVLVPLIFLLLLIALLATTAFSIHPALAHHINRLNGWVADACVFSAQGFAAIPGSHIALGGESQPLLLIYDLEYGSGAACFSDGKGAAVLIDCGDRHSFEFLVAPSLQKLRIAPDSVVLSHPDGGHLGGGSQVWETFPIRQALLPVKRSRSPSFRAWTDHAPQAGVRLYHADETKTLAMPDGATLEVLHAPEPHAHNELANDRVAIFRLHWRGWKILFTSDAGMGTELRVLDARVDVSADVIIAGRHRTDLTLCDAFLDAVDPQAIIASNQSHPEGEAVLPTTISYWKSRGIRVIDQATTGAVTLRIDESGNLEVAGFLRDQPLVLRQR